jgi:type I restriction enzyme S subunit
MSFPRYPTYKPSGVEWLGEVPEHWNVDRMKWAIEQPKNGIWGNEESGDENDIPCVRVADFDRQGMRVFLDNPTIRNVTRKEREGRVLVKNDLLIEKSGGGELQPVGCVVIYEDDRPAISSNFVAKASARIGMSASYWRYLHSAAYAARINTRSIKQTSGIQNLDQSQYLDESSCYPPLREQERIATFLDHETAKIDALIAEQQRLIELLQEKRQAVISHAVTKGLNPHAPMKDSGVEWLGEVPEHWEVCRIKNVGKSVIGLTYSPSDVTEAESGIPVLRASNIQDGRLDWEDTVFVNMQIEPSLLLRPGDILICARSGSRDLIGKNILIAESDLAMTPSFGAFMTVLRCIDPPFLRWTLSSTIFKAQSGAYMSTTINQLTSGTLMGTTLALPPNEERGMICQYLDNHIAKVDGLVSECRQAVSLLQERRSALISAAVTGQIDVRGLVPEAEAA